MMVPTAHEAERLTGLLAGGISPLALLHKGFQIVIAEEAQMLDEVHVSGGERGLNLRLGVSDLANLTQASFARISRPEAADS
jgi:Cys-tRNA(Pro)/Cys-tRNA(Cys) deacylase